MEEKLQTILRRLEQDRWKYYNISRKSAEFLSILAKLSQAKNVLEVGTANGYSALWLANAIKENGGKITTVEIDPVVMEEAKKNFLEAGLHSAIEVKIGDAREVIKGLAGNFDFLFLDAVPSQYRAYLEVALPKLIQNALIVADNVLSHQNQAGGYLEFVERNTNLESSVVPLGGGLGIALKKDGSSSANQTVREEIVNNFKAPAF